MTFVMKTMLVIYPYSTHYDFIRDGLGGMGYSRRLYKKTIPNSNLLEDNSKPELKKNKKIYKL
jgi:hypothetical protein